MSPNIRPEVRSRCTPQRPRVVVVDDDPVIRELLAEVLSDCEVSLFGSALDALRHLEATGTPDAILSDVVMPVMDGVAFFSNLTEEQQARTVFMTGGCSVEIEAILARIGRPVLSKPFSLRVLRSALGVVA